MIQPKIVLYVEDDEDDALLMQEVFLAFPSLTLVHALSPPAALTRLIAFYDEGITPCLVLSDVNMPGMDGIQLLHTLRHDTRFKRIPFVLISTAKSDEITNAGWVYDAGVAHKPSSFKELQQTATTLLSRYCLPNKD